MVTIELKGGLGNQLFQYAAGIGLARHLQTELIADIVGLQMPDEVLGTYRTYKLNKLNEAPVVNTGHKENAVIKKTKKIFQKLNIGGGTVYKEKYFHYDAGFWALQGKVLLKGNFQSEKYFLPYKKDVIERLRFNKALLSVADKEVLSQITTNNSLSIHIRRGDYLSNKIASDVLGILPIEYYTAAYRKILDEITLENVFVFSDDIDWAENNLSFVDNAVFINSKGNNNDLVDFILMQHCSHNIVANSSFSWWAAYLNPNPDKIVIAPKRWFNKAPYDTKDLIPEGWIRI